MKPVSKQTIEKTLPECTEARFARRDEVLANSGDARQAKGLPMGQTKHRLKGFSVLDTIRGVSTRKASRLVILLPTSSKPQPCAFANRH